MARKYSSKASAKVGRAMKERKRGTLKSGRSGRKVKSRKQAIAIGLSEARRMRAKPGYDDIVSGPSGFWFREGIGAC
jgi:hypothetical protein